ncbi:MAG: serine/threonine protein kinase [Bacteroidia bacterium]|nr:serine/threonine protein kinase [Bacteroidia bacterium]
MINKNTQFTLSGICPSCFHEKEGARTCPACGYNAAASESDWNRLRPGTVLCERYVVGKALGQGGFGVTYLGLDTRLHAKLAIKEYYPSGVAARNSASRSVMHASDDMAEDFKRGMEKFLEEARTLARFEEHPNIVSVKDFFEENGTAYMVMNFVDGKTLAEHLKERGGRIPFDEAMSILSPLMDALDEIHASGTIHRDLSPDNIFITHGGLPKLLDFGASKSAFALMQRRSHSVILKHGYSPPEQYQSRGRLGPWTDVYGMAATLYQCVTGKTPPDSLDRLEEDEKLLSPNENGASIPEYAEIAIIHALSLPANSRPQSMSDFQSALLQIKVSETKKHEASASMTDEPSTSFESLQTPPRPKSITILCIVMVLLNTFLLLTFLFAFPSEYVYFLAIMQFLSLIPFWGYWRMKKWGVISYAVLVSIEIFIILIDSNFSLARLIDSNWNTLLRGSIVVGLGREHYNEMS